MADVLMMGMAENPSKFDLIEQEQLAAQMLAVLDAHFKRPDCDEKLMIIKVAHQQIEATRLP
jgi:hypothetical protein